MSSGKGGDNHEDGWEVFSKKSRSRTNSGATVNQRGSSAAAPRTSGQWATPSGAGRSAGNIIRRPGGRYNPRQQLTTKGLESQSTAPSAVASAPLQHGWQWAARGSSSGSQHASTGRFVSDPDSVPQQPEDESDDDDDDDDDDLVDSDDDDYDSDASKQSHETRKKNRWFKAFFEDLDNLTMEELSEQTRQWHCPACHNGPGAIEWYKGLQPLMAHAKTKGSTRVKLHRELAALLEEEFRIRGTSVMAGEAFGKWKGLNETATDLEIIWPPMVVIMNTLLDKDENDKWTGMGNQELVDYFNSYAAVRARHSYGPNGHRGMSILIFEPTAMGYMEAERLHRHFQEQGTDLDAWENRRIRTLFTSGGKRQLYGYLARKEDMEVFNQHSQGKSRLKYDLKSYYEMVVTPMKQMNEDNQKLTYLKNKVVKEEQKSKVLKETFEVVSQKLRETMEENRIVRLRTKIQHEENKEEMDFQEKFFKEQMDKVHKVIEEKEKTFERLLQEERVKARQSDVSSGTNEDWRLRKEEIARFIASQVKGVEEFEAEREKLIQDHEDRKVELKLKYLAEEVALEKEFDAALTKLMEMYAPGTFQPSTASNS